MPVLEFAAKSERFKDHFHGYKTDCLHWPGKSLPIPPYILGVWLGDGTSSQPQITSMDEEIIAEFEKYGAERGCFMRRRQKIGTRAYCLTLTAKWAMTRSTKGEHTNPMMVELSALGVLNNKHIPQDYLASSEAQRLELLAGLIDTDGSMNRNCYEFTNKNERLIREVKYVADTLGFKTNLRPRITKCNGKSFPSFRLSITGDVHRIPVRVPRKRCAPTAGTNRDWTKTRIDIEPAGVGEFFGFALDGDHLFLLEDGTVTHNSFNFALALIILATKRCLRILCVREFQTSIADSVHAILRGQITINGLSNFFKITERSIRCITTGSEFIFKGLHHNVDQIKSTEGIDICWIEEAHSVSEESLKYLIPTIRRDAPFGPFGRGSEIWISFNQHEDRDPVYKRFVGKHRPDSIVRAVTWENNPYFPGVLDAERKYMMEDDPDAYEWVWGMSCRRIGSEIIFQNKYVIEEFEAPKDARFFFGADWGFANDPTVLIRQYITTEEDGDHLWIDYEAFGYSVEIDETPALFCGDDKISPPRWSNPKGYKGIPGAQDWPIKGDSSRPETISYLSKRGVNVVAAEKWEGCVEDGIAHLKGFRKIHIHQRCKRLAQEARLYSYKVDRQTGDVLPVIVDKHNHGWDSCIREGELISTDRGHVPVEQVVAGDKVLTRDGYQRVTHAWKVSDNREIWSVTAGGQTLLATPDHRVFTANRGFVRVDALRYDDDLLVEASQCALKSRNTEAEHSGAIQTPSMSPRASIFDALSTVFQNSCTAMFGSQSAALFQTASTSITSTKIQRTIISEILSRLLLPIIPQRTCHGAMSGKSGIQSFLQKYDHSRRHGTPHQRGSRNIGRSALSLMLDLSRSISHAMSAAASLPQELSGTRIDFAPTPASQPIAENQEWTTKSAGVSCAGPHSRPTNTDTRNLVLARVQCVRDTQTTAAVFDLSVETNQEFFASGILVHNCRYALDGYIQHRGGLAVWERLGS
jgi:phage terminase large subunit